MNVSIIFAVFLTVMIFKFDGTLGCYMGSNHPSLNQDENVAKFSFNGTLQKTMEVYEYPSSIKVRWFNFLEGDDSDTPWVHCDGKSSVFPVTWSSGHFGFEMEEKMDSFDESITTDPIMISYWAKYLSKPEEEIANIKFAMGFVTGQYKNDAECVFGNDLGFQPDKGPNGEMAFAHRYAVFYRNGDLHCGPDNGNRPDGGKICSSESWWFKIPQGFSCGLGVDVPGSHFDGFVPVDCSEIVVKVAKAKSCRRNPDLGDDCFNFVNWT